MTKLRRIMDDKQPTIERWKPVNGHEGIYEASSHGRVRSLDRVVHHVNGYSRRMKGNILALTPHPRTGHLTVGLSKNGKPSTHYVHQIVAFAFFGPRPDGMVVRHLDDDVNNNHISNLQFGTQSQNMHDAVRNGKNKHARKTHCKRGHELVPENVVTSKSNIGWRGCLSCNRAQSYVRYHPELKPQLQAIADSYFNAILNERQIAA